MNNPHAAEARERWGETPQYRQSQRRTAQYTDADWAELTSESAALVRRLAEAMRAGTPPDGVAAMDLAEEHRRQIDGRFYDCDHTMHRALGDMYVADPRFSAHYDDAEPGLAQYLRDAIHANADRAQV
jgi:hypothetical protein